MFSLSVVVHASNPNVKVGVYYYAWYDPESSIGYFNWSYPLFQDKPVLGFYDSLNETVIETHLGWMQDLGVDFAIISWWGNGNSIDDAAKLMFEIVRSKIYRIKLCLMVEDYDDYNFTFIYDYVYDNYVEPYPSIYFSFQDKPLILFYNSEDLLERFTLDDRFTVKISGHESYAEWIYNHYEGYEPWKTWSKTNYEIPKCRVYPVSPRYDDYYVRFPNYTVDRDYRLGIYKMQWENAIKSVREGKTDIITVCSWNEFPERTQIEPCYDRDSFNGDPYYLYNLTKNFIAKLKGLTVEPETAWYNEPKRFVMVIGICACVIFVAYTFYRRN